MKKLMAILACGVLVGCDYSVPLVTAPEMGIDPGLVGLWQRSQGDGQTESLLVLPLGKLEYLVSYPAASTNGMFARACLCRTADRTLVQLEWLGNAHGILPDDSRVFQYAEYAIAGDTITIRMLNTDLVKADVKSTAKLVQAIADNKEKPDLFRNEMVFKKVKDEP